MSPKPLDWSTVFDEVVERAAPASPAAIARIFDRVSDDEAAAVVAAQRSPWPANDPRHAAWSPLDPRRWTLPRGPLPKEYQDFLAWSDGASWQTGEREFSCFGCEHLREYLLHYHFPEYLPGVVPIGLDGGGVFGVFNLAESPAGAVWAIESGVPFWEDAVPIAASFEEFCRGTVRLGEAYNAGFAVKRRAT